MGGTLQSKADDTLQGTVKVSPDRAVKVFFGQLFGRQRNQFAPLLTGCQHAGDEFNAVPYAAVTVQQQGVQGTVKNGILAAELPYRSAGSFAIKRGGVLHRLAPADAAGEQGHAAY